jgi:hypothetical protein
LGPPFQTNLIWANRFLQVSLALPETTEPGRARAIPVAFDHCPTPRKPKPNAPDTTWKDYNKLKRAMKITGKGLAAIERLRMELDRQQAEARQLIVAVDGGYTNGDLLRNLPARTTLIGRLRKDAKLFKIPQSHSGPGRKPFYGDPMPTPEEIRRDPDIPWQTCEAFAAGRKHDFQVKTVAPLRWRAAGEKDLRLVVVKPLHYRLSRQAKLLYRDPAYLICSDPDLPLEDLLQDYIWRWGIELNFREQKQLIGCGQAHIRSDNAIRHLPPFLTAAYAFLLLAAHQVATQQPHFGLPPAKWTPKNKTRTSTGDLINTLRNELWAKSIRKSHLHHFDNSTPSSRCALNRNPSAFDAVFYARK